MTTQTMPQKSSSIGNAAAGRRNISAGRSEPTHDQIAALARTIWESKGCPADRDEENWREAEMELRNMGKAGR